MNLLMTGPLWYDQRTGQVLTASRRYVKCKKTAGDLAASLQLNVWWRAEEPGKLMYTLCTLNIEIGIRQVCTKYVHKCAH